MAKDYLTTTQAARLLSVAPDTVLKWVRAGKIKSYRTPGGHARIPIETVNALLSEHAQSEEPNPTIQKPHQFCWEYLAVDGKVNEKCLDCLTYKSRAKRCYELRDVLDSHGCLRIGCELSCEECDYYKLVHGQVSRILIFSETRQILSDHTKLELVKDLEVKFAEDEYESSYLIEKFRPDFIVVDVAIGKRRSTIFCNHLFNDPRIPVPRIILASKTMDIKDYCHKEVFGWIRKPFTVDELRQCVQSVSMQPAAFNVSHTRTNVSGPVVH